MWTRALIKTNAKQILSGSYWKAFLVCLVAGILGGGTNLFNLNLSSRSSNSSSYYNYYYSYGVDAYAILQQVMAFVLPFLLVGGILGLCFYAFVGGPVNVGSCRFFMENRVGDSPFSTVFSTFNGSYMNVVKGMFTTRLFTFFWSLLFIVPGIIKSYQWFFVPYLLAENPYMEPARARELSRQMTDGEKMNIFVLQLSFYGWYLLGALACGVGILFVNPYYEATVAELYAAMRAKAFAMGITDENELGDFMRY